MLNDMRFWYSLYFAALTFVIVQSFPLIGITLGAVGSFIANAIGNLIGVLAAFALDRWMERKHIQQEEEEAFMQIALFLGMEIRGNLDELDQIESSVDLMMERAKDETPEQQNEGLIALWGYAARELPEAVSNIMFTSSMASGIFLKVHDMDVLSEIQEAYLRLSAMQRKARLMGVFYEEFVSKRKVVTREFEPYMIERMLSGIQNLRDHIKLARDMGEKAIALINKKIQTSGKQIPGPDRVEKK